MTHPFRVPGHCSLTGKWSTCLLKATLGSSLSWVTCSFSSSAVYLHQLKAPYNFRWPFFESLASTTYVCIDPRRCSETDFHITFWNSHQSIVYFIIINKISLFCYYSWFKRLCFYKLLCSHYTRSHLKLAGRLTQSELTHFFSNLSVRPFVVKTIREPLGKTAFLFFFPLSCLLALAQLRH